MMRPPLRHGERGQALVIIAASFVVLIILGTLVFDVGLATSDRRNLQAYADAAALGGARSYTAVSTQGAHYTAMQYLAGPLGFTLPQGGCTSSAACPVGTYTVAPYTIQLADSSLPGWAYPSVLDVVITHQQTSIFGNILGFASVSVGTSARAAKPGPQTTPALYSVAAVAGDVSVNGGGNGIQTATGAVYAFGSLGANNGPHSMGIPRVTTNYDGSACAGSPTNEADFGGNTTNGMTWHWEPNGSATTVTNKAAPTTFDSLWTDFQRSHLHHGRVGEGRVRPLEARHLQRHRAERRDDERRRLQDHQCGEPQLRDHHQHRAHGLRDR